MVSVDFLDQPSLRSGQLEWTLESNCPHTDSSHALSSQWTGDGTMDSVDSVDTSIQPYTVYGFAYSQNEMVDLQNRKPFSIAEYRLSILSILSTTTTTPFLISTERLEAGVWTVEWTVGGQGGQLSTVHRVLRARSWTVGV